MTVNQTLPDLLPAAPELALVGGALLLLMFGVYRGERSGSAVSLGAIMLLVAGAGLIIWLPRGTL
ncbi:MAG: NADH-quinone oxidoreductase subunit N, partial [Pseudorhodoplanes sp.]|nr:NADH-quinone oxidoreductase subunit N [Pseudorhodoplanes sp.]